MQGSITLVPYTWILLKICCIVIWEKLEEKKSKITVIDWIVLKSWDLGKELEHIILC